MMWAVQEECGYSFRLAEYADGTTALYRVYPDGRIVPDKHSVMVHELNCPACGERMNPAVDKATGKPEPDFYGCAACGYILEFYGEEADPVHERAFVNQTDRILSGRVHSLIPS